MFALKLIQTSPKTLDRIIFRSYSIPSKEKTIQSLMAKYPQQAPKKSFPKFPRPETKPKLESTTNQKGFLRSLVPFVVGAVIVTVFLNIGVAAFDPGNLNLNDEAKTIL